jgi:hypothetical protein
LTRWVEQVRQALDKSTKIDEWQLIGTSVIVEHTTERHGREIVKAIALILKLPVIELQFNFDNLKIDIEEPAIYCVANNVWGPIDKPPIIDNNVSSDLVSVINSILSHNDPVRPSIILLMTDDFIHIPESLRCLGKFDRRFDCRLRTNEQIGKEFIDWLGWDICAESIKTQVKRVGRLLRSEVNDERRQGLIIAGLRRRCADTQQLLNFVDVLHFALHGTSEFDVEKSCNKSFQHCSVHEAGHAVVAMLDSNGDDIPDYASIGTSHNFSGITTSSFSYRINDDIDQSAVLHRVRTCLGGRAAEQIVFGALGMGTHSSRSDLLCITNLLLEMYLSSGFFSDLDEAETSTDHIVVAMDEPMPHQLRRAELAARKFIAKQYPLVLAMLSNNRELLDIVSHELITKELLINEDFNRIWIDYASKKLIIAA